MQRMESNLTLLGATAIEDKLQKDVPETIASLLRAGINIWMLTGDKMETAINIGRSCRLHEPYMQLVIVDENSYENANHRIKQLIAQCEIDVEYDDRENITNLALVIDGSTLQHTLVGELRGLFGVFALHCRVVICCRVSPMQKAEVVELIRETSGDLTLAIGDGGNDVGMIEAAHVGVGITGHEGLQAANAADYCIGQFRFLCKLLLVHGHWSFARNIKVIVYSLYKNSCFTWINMCFMPLCVFSGEMIFSRWLYATYNLFFVSLIPLAIGIFDRPAKSSTMLKHECLYSLSQNRDAFSLKMFAVLHAASIFVLSFWILMHNEVWHSHGRASSRFTFSTGMYAYLMTIMGAKGMLEMDAWTWPVYVSVGLPTAGFFSFVLLYAAVWPDLPCCNDMSGVAYDVFGSATFWLGLPVIVVASLLPDIVYKVIQRTFYKTSVDRIREFERSGDQNNIQKMTKAITRVTKKMRRVLLPVHVADVPKNTTGFAFSQEENGAVAQSSLVRMDLTSRSSRSPSERNSSVREAVNVESPLLHDVYQQRSSIEHIKVE